MLPLTQALINLKEQQEIAEVSWPQTTQIPILYLTCIRIHITSTLQNGWRRDAGSILNFITQFMLDVMLLKMLLYKPSLRALSSPRSFETIHNRIIRINSDISGAKITARVMLLAPLMLAVISLELEICSRDSHFIVTACNIRYINTHLYRCMQVIHGVYNCSNQ